MVLMLRSSSPKPSVPRSKNSMIKPRAPSGWSLTADLLPPMRSAGERNVHTSMNSSLPTMLFATMNRS
jgi:hypothetical protein